MNLSDFSTKIQISEVAMNPTAYAKSIDVGETSGVLVGVEFEVCMPKEVVLSATEAERAAFLASREGQVDAERVQSIIKRFDHAVWNVGVSNNVSRDKFDQYFTPNNSSNFPSAAAAELSYLENNLEEAKQILSQLPSEKLRDFTRLSKNKISRHFREGRYGSLTVTPQEKESLILRDIAERYKSAAGAEYRMNRREPEASARLSTIVIPVSRILNLLKIHDIEYIFKTMWPTVTRQSEVFNNFNNYFTYDPQAVYDAFNLMSYDQTVPYSMRNNRSGGYDSVAKVLKLSLERTMGADVVVYSSYHQATKNMTSWYIEPDGSLQPNNGDGAAEVVGPPEPPKAALTSLRKFFDLASELKLYTSKRNNTGLHINVSIPKELDVLKLAVMLGDEYILKKFDRENNNYAKSVMNNLNTPSANRRVASTVMSNIKTPYNSTESKIDLDLLKEIAERISGDHFSSINWTGKYISFRHAGGNYLKDYNEILNVVGRFVRAMVIASDPNAYRNEYLKAVVKLVNKRQPVRLTDNARYINDIKQNGLVIKTIDLYLKKDKFNNPSISDFETILSREHKIVPGVNCSVTTSSEEARQTLITKSKKSGTGRAEMSNPEKSPIQQFARCNIIPYTIDRAQDERRNDDLGDYRLGVYTQQTPGAGISAGYKYISINVIPATDPRAIKFMRSLRASPPRY